MRNRIILGIIVALLLVGIALILAVPIIRQSSRTPPAAVTSPPSRPADGRIGTEARDDGSSVDVPMPAEYGDANADVERLVLDIVRDVRQAPDDAGVWLRLAKTYHANAFHDLARTCYDRSMALESSDPHTWYFRALLNAKIGRLDEAIADMQHAAKLAPDYPATAWRLGLYMIDQGKLDEAQDAIARALQLGPDNPNALLARAKLNIASNQLPEAVTILEELQRRPGPNAGYIAQLLSVAYTRLGRTQDAERMARRGDGSKPQWNDPWFDAFTDFNVTYNANMKRVTLLRQQRRFREAIAILRRLHNDQPDNTTIKTQLGNSLIDVGSIEPGLQLLREVVAATPTQFTSHFQIAAALARIAPRVRGATAQAMREEAAYEAQQTLELNPTYPDAHGILGDLALSAGDWTTALVKYEAARSLELDNPRWTYRIAVGSIQAQQWDRAEAEFDSLTQLTPENAEAWRGLAVARLSKGSLEIAAEALKQARVLAPDDPRIAETAKAIEQARSAPHR